MVNRNPDMLLADVDSGQQHDCAGLAFRPDIEAVYRQNSQSEHRKYALHNMFIGTMLFDSYIICDYINDIGNIQLFLLARFFIVTPVCLGILAGIKIFDLHLRRYYFALVCTGPVLMCLANSILLIRIDTGGYRLSYLFGEIVIMLCAVVLCRPPVRTACLMIAAQVVCYNVALVGSNIVEAGILLANCMFAVASGLIAIMNAYVLERMSRQAFLLNRRITLLNREFERLSVTDPLTGLGNRRALEEATQRVWDSSDKGRVVSVILLDVDHFKSFNDTYGHPAGDRCLSDIGRCVKQHIREGQDLAIRFGGEELLILLPDTDFRQARQIAETVRSAISSIAIPHSALGQNVVVTASIGVASASTLDYRPAELVGRADAALYDAKRNGRNQVWPTLDIFPGTRDRATTMAAVA